MIGIYKITSPSDRIYIGQSIDINKRFRKYYNHKCKQQPKLYNSLCKYGVDAHKFEVIEECTQEQLNNRERYYQEYFNSVETGLNLLYVKSEHFNGRHSEESKKKISNGLKGKPIHENTRLALIESNKNRIISEATKEKHRQNNTGKTYSQETKDKQRAKRLGSKRSEETKRKMSESAKKVIKKPISEETRLKMSISQLKRYRKEY
jgi:group I intron endonuclease